MTDADPTRQEPPVTALWSELDALTTEQLMLKFRRIKYERDGSSIKVLESYLESARRRDADRQRLAARITELEAALAERVAQPRLNAVPLYTNERIDDLVDSHIFHDSGTSTYRVWEDRATKYIHEMRDAYEKEIAFWQRYGVVKNLELVEAKARPRPALDAMPSAVVLATIKGLLESAIAGTESTIRARRAPGDYHGLRKFSTTEEEWVARYEAALTWLATLRPRDATGDEA